MPTLTPTRSNHKTVILTATDGRDWVYVITQINQAGPAGSGWRVQGDDIDHFVPFGCVAFPTAAAIVQTAYDRVDAIGEAVQS